MVTSGDAFGFVRAFNGTAEMKNAVVAVTAEGLRGSRQQMIGPSLTWCLGPISAPPRVSGRWRGLALSKPLFVPITCLPGPN